MIEDVPSVADFRPRPGMMYHPLMTYKRGTKLYVSSDLLRKMLEAQVPIVCDCNEMCNFGVRPSEKRGLTAFVSCARARGRTSTEADPGDCKFFGLTPVDGRYMWDFAADGIKGDYAFTAGAAKRKRDEIEPPPVTAAALGAGLTGGNRGAVSAGAEGGGNALPRGWDRLRPDERAAIQTIINGMLLH